MKDKENSVLAPETERRQKKFNASNEHRRGTEIVSRRGEFTKHYDLGGGRFQMVAFPEPVHYQQEGEWKEIDNTLVESLDMSARKIMRNVDNPLHVEFAKQPDAEALVQITTEGKTLSWRFDKPSEDCKAYAMPLETSVAGISEQEKRGIVQGERSKMVYENLKPGMDVIYTLDGRKFKEDIILHSAEAAQYAVMQLSDDYYYTVDQFNVVSAECKSGEPAPFVFSAPFAYDANEKEIPVDVKLFGPRMTYVISEAKLASAAYPITIDPMISITSGIEWKTFYKGASGTRNVTDMYSGVTGSHECATVLRLKSLNGDGMRRSDTVTGAFLQFKDRTRKSSTYLAAYQVMTDWNGSTVTWDALRCSEAGKATNERLDPVMLDCQAGGKSYLTLNITRAYRHWKSTNKNYGVLLRRPHVMSDKSYIRFRSPTMYVNYISHAGLAGWWKYEDQSAERAGTAHVDIFNGNLVLEHPDMKLAGNRMSAGVTHYYNSCLSSYTNSPNPKVSNDFHCGQGFKLSVQQCVTARKAGNDWFFVWTDGTGLDHWFKKRASGKESADLEGMNYKLVYTAQKDSKPEKITITDSSHTVMTFKRRTSVKHAQWANFWLVEICDSIRRASGVYNKLAFAYKMPAKLTDATALAKLEGQVASVTDSAGRSIKFTYDTNSRLLTTIEWPGLTKDGVTASRKMYYAYDSENHLTGIGYHDLQPVGSTEPEYHTAYEYQGNLLTTVRNYNGKRIEIQYDMEGAEKGHACNCGCPYCCGALGDSAHVSAIEFIVTGGDGIDVRGAKQTFEYGVLTTTVTAVENTETDSGKKLKYQFNDSGNVVSVLDELGFAQFAKFSPNVPNQPTEVSKLQRVVLNRLNPFYSASDWVSDSDVFVGFKSKVNEIRLLGTPTAKVPFGKRTSQTVSLKRGETYTASVYATATNRDDTAKARLRVKFDDQVFTSEYADVEMMLQANSIGLGGWARISYTFEVPAGTDDAQVTVELANESEVANDVRFGWPQLEQGTTANHVNLLYNSNFTKGIDTESTVYKLPGGWKKEKEYTLDGNNRVVTAPEDFPPILSGHCLKISSTPKKDKRKIMQVLPITGGKNAVFTLGGWAKALSLPGEAGKKPYFDLAIAFKNKDGKYAKTFYLSYNKAQREWQFACRAVIAPYNFTAVRVECVYSYNAEHALFSNLFLTREEFGQSFTYDNDKDVVSITDRASQKCKIKYDGAKNIISYRKPGKPDSEVYTANFSAATKSATKKQEQRQHQPRWEKTPMGVLTQYSYDKYGNVTKTRVQKSGKTGKDDLCLGAITGYTADGMFAVSSTDARGFKATKNIDPKLGRVNSATDPKGTKVEYAYDAADRVTDVTCQPDAENEAIIHRNHYTYENDQIKTVSHNTANANSCDVTYTFGYDALGRKTTVAVGEQVLSENVYGSDRSGLLKEVQYGNGGKVRYTHDDFDRVTGISYDDEAQPRYNYTFDAEARTSKVEDKHLNRTAWSEYDLAGRPIRSNHTELGADGKQKLFYRTRLGYDTDNTLREFCETAGGKNYKTNYNYDKDDRTKRMAFHTGNGIRGLDYGYDGIGRVSQVLRGAATMDGKTIKVTSNAALKTTYTYAPGSSIFGKKATTPLVQTINHGDGKLKYMYTYDATGNITKVVETKGATSRSVEYQYDKLGQLIRVDDATDTTSGETGTTWTYQYDLGGNILKKQRYAYTPAGTPLDDIEPIECIPYVYDSVWKDKLDQYNGRPIVYDEIGNPLRYNGTTYEWSGGRQLKRMTMRSNVGKDGIDAEDGADPNGSGTVIRICFTNGNMIAGDITETTAAARVLRNGKDITDDQMDACFAWTRESGNAAADAAWAAAHKGMKEIKLTAADLNGDVRIKCDLTGEAGLYGIMKANSSQIIYHTPSDADANHVFCIEKGELLLKLPVEAEAPALPDEPESDPDEVIEELPVDDEELEEPEDMPVEAEDTEIVPEDPDAEENPDAVVADDAEPADEVEENLDADELEEPEDEVDDTITGADIPGEEETGDDPVNETEDEVYEEFDELPDEDLVRMPKGLDYELVEHCLGVNAGLNGTITATAMVYATLPDKVVEFKYNADGLRIQKKVITAEETVTTDYILHGKLITHQTVTTVIKGLDSSMVEEAHIFYNNTPLPTQIVYDGNIYTYLTNLQGDITAVVDSQGIRVVEYHYNAWGKILSVSGLHANTLGNFNPFRYRSYVYDADTELYYLRNRYYNPEMERFINADNIYSRNLFAYCINSPVVLYDENGREWRGAIHRAVQIHITSKYSNIIMEVPCIKLTGGRGRIDLACRSTGECWEIKPFRSFKMGADQLGNYTHGKILDPNWGKDVKPTRGGPIIGDTFNTGNYVVKYWYAGAGVILYSYTAILPPPERKKDSSPSSASDPIIQPNFAPAPQFEPSFEEDDGWDWGLALAGGVLLIAALLAPATGGSSLAVVALI